MPPPDMNNRIDRWVATSHGSIGHLAMTSTLIDGREEADMARGLLGAALVDRSHLGTRVWDIIGSPNEDFTFHVPFQLPHRIPQAPVGTTVELFLSAITVDCRANADTSGLQSTFTAVTAYNGDTQIASFPTPGWRGGEQTFRLTELKAIRAGLDVVYGLEVPLGATGSFEFRSTLVALARPRALPIPGDVVARVRAAIGG